MLGTALWAAARSSARNWLTPPIPLEAMVTPLPVRGGESDLLRALFAPLGYTVKAEPIPLDPAHPGMGRQPAM